jgi:hypothetical protein
MLVSALILLAMLGAGAWNVVRVARESGPATIAATALPAEEPLAPLLLETAYQTAAARAAQWSAGAMLTFAGLQADWPLDAQPAGPPEIPPGGWVRFAFLDPERAELLSLQIERYTGQIVTEDIQPWTDHRPADLPVGATVVTSGDAVRIAEAALGQEFRTECPVDRHRSDVILLVATGEAGPALAAGTPLAGTPVATPVTVDPAAAVGTPIAGSNDRPVRWLVTYRDDQDPSTNAIEMEIGARDGQILRIEDRSGACG